MAIDESVGEAIAQGMSPPTIRFYGWRPSAVTIGCFQSIEEEVDLSKCDGLGIDVVRRRTGGGAVYHDEKGEITYSVIAPDELMDQDIIASYKAVCSRIVLALRDIGISAEFYPINDILVNGRKISGSAQSRRNGVFLQHGTVLYDIDPRMMFSVLNVSAEKICDKGLESAIDRVTCVKHTSGASVEDLLERLKERFVEGLDWNNGPLKEDELKRAQVLAKERYSSRDWNFSR